MADDHDHFEVTYQRVDLPDEAPLELREVEGGLDFRLSRDHYTEIGARALTAIVIQAISSGRWRQNWTPPTGGPQG